MYHMVLICSCSEDTTNPYTAHETLINNTVIVDDGPIEAKGYDIGEEPKATIIDVLANDKARPASSGPLFVSGFVDVSRRARRNTPCGPPFGGICTPPTVIPPTSPRTR